MTVIPFLNRNVLELEENCTIYNPKYKDNDNYNYIYNMFKEFATFDAEELLRNFDIEVDEAKYDEGITLLMESDTLTKEGQWKQCEFSEKLSVYFYLYFYLYFQ